MTPVHESAVKSLQWRLGAMLALRQIVLFATLWAFVWGTIALAVRVVSGVNPDWLVWGLVGFALAAVVGIARGIMRVPASKAVRALLDRTSAGGGLLMTAGEMPMGEWDDRVPSPAELRVRWDARKGVGLFTAAASFLAIALLFPQSLASWNPGLEVGEDVKTLIAKIELLKEEKILDPKRAEFLKDKLEQVRDEAKGRDPAKTLEALEHVNDQLMKAAKQAAENATKKNEKLGLAESIAQGLRKSGASTDSKLTKDALAELAALVQAATEETMAAEQGLDPDVLKHLQDSKLSPEELKALADALKGAKATTGKAFDKLAKARLIDPETLKKLLEAGECEECQGCECEVCRCGGPTLEELAKSKPIDAKKLEKLLKAASCKECKDNEKVADVVDALSKREETGDLTLKELEALADALKDCKECADQLAKSGAIDADMLARLIQTCDCRLCKGKGKCVARAIVRAKRGGRGGLTEGPGHNPITWTDGTSEEGAKFKEIVLPPGGIQKSKIVGVGKADPKKQDVSTSSGGALTRDNAGGGGANSGVLLPQHRTAVEKYFHREEKK